jgi:diacylglycerol kinase family enzyme
LDAVLFGYFARLEKGARPEGVLRGLFRFLKELGKPSVTLVHDGRRTRARAPLISVANGPFVGMAYAIAPQARIDDGWLDVVVFREASVLFVLFHLLVIAGGRSLPQPPTARVIRARSLLVSTRRKPPLPVHADGVPIGVTPARFEVAPAALRVIVGPPEPTGICAWETPASTQAR